MSSEQQSGWRLAEHWLWLPEQFDPFDCTEICTSVTERLLETGTSERSCCNSSSRSWGGMASVPPVTLPPGSPPQQCFCVPPPLRKDPFVLAWSSRKAARVRGAPSLWNKALCWTTYRARKQPCACLLQVKDLYLPQPLKERLSAVALLIN